MTNKKLNIGCGCDIREGWVNIDKYKSEGVNVVLDLEKKGILSVFKKNSVDYIYTSHFLEHIHNTDEVFLDCLQILKHNGIFEIILPHCSRVKTYTLYHKREFCSYAFDELLDKESSSKSLQTIRPHDNCYLILLERELVWLNKPKNILLKGLNKLVGTIINFSPFIQNIVENYLCYYIGGLREFRIKFKVVKK